MSNKEILLSLNENSKKFIDDFYSYASFFNKNKDNIYNEKNNNFENIIKTKEGIIILSLLFSAIKNDSFLSDFFNDFGINYDFLTQIIKFKDDTTFSDIKFKSALESDMITEINLNKLYNRVLFKLKYSNYLDEEKIFPETIEIYQIFDYLTQENIDILLDFLYSNYNSLSLNKDINKLLKEKLHEKYSEYVLSHYSFDLDEKIENETSELYEFDDCQIIIKKDKSFITFKSGTNLQKTILYITKDYINDYDELVDGNFKPWDKVINTSLLKKDFIINYQTPCTFILKTINKKKIEKSYIENNLKRKTEINLVPFEIETFDGETFIIWMSKERTFLPETKKDNNKRLYSISTEKMLDDFDNKNNATPYLDKYGFDLTKDKYIKDPSIGRDDIIKRIEQILLYPERDKSIIITGVAGSGKTALAKGLAYRIQKGDVPKALKNLRIISLDSATLVAGTKYVGTLEEKMKGILDEASQSKDIILFIDEIHQTLGAGVSEKDNNSVSEILKPYLDYGRVRVIGATTTEEYEEFVSTNDAFKTRFKKINISEPDDSIVYQILDDLINSYNKLSDSNEILCPKLELNHEDKDMIINWLIESTREKYRTYNDRCSNPRLVLDIIKESYAIAAMRDSDIVEIQDITYALSLEERLYKSSREKQIKELDNYKPSKPKNNIIEFRMIKKES